MSTRSKIIAGLAILCTAAGLTYWAAQARVDRRVYRIGFEHNPPNMIVGAGGKLNGLAVDVVREAASRARVELEWVDGATEQASIDNRKLHLSPLMAAVPWRNNHYFSAPCLEGHYVMLFRAGQPAPGKNFDGTVGHYALRLHDRMVSLNFPEALHRGYDTRDALLGAVCAGEVDVVLVEDRAAARFLWAGAAGLATCELAQAGPRSMSWGSRSQPRQGAPAADRLRDEISRMALDGSLAAHIDRYANAGFDLYDATTSYSIAQEQSFVRWLRFGSALLLICLFGLIWRNSQLRRSRRCLLAAQEALAESECLWRMLFEGANDAIFLHEVPADGDSGAFIAANRAALSRLGFRAQDYAGLTPGEIGAIGNDEVQRMVTSQLQQQGHVTFESALRCADGSTIPVEISASRFHVNGVAQVISIARDLTKRKRTEEEIQLLAAVIRQAVETVVITDASGAIVYVNPAFERSSGYSAAEALGQKPSLLKSGKHDVEFYRQMWATLAAGDVWRGRIYNRRKNGEIYLEESSISPVRDSSRRVTHYIAMKLDITNEAQLQEQLCQAQKMESVGRLAGGVAHDFNNLLTVINGYTQLLLERTGNDDRLHAQLTEIHHAGDRAAALTRQLLAFSRRQVLETRVVDLNRIVTGMRPMLERLLGEAIELRVEVDPGGAVVRADPHQLEQVLMNLAVNARDAMPRGGRLLISTSHAAKSRVAGVGEAGDVAGRLILLTVSDNGAGMDEDTRLRAFEPFFTTKASGLGTGLGLSMVKGIVEQSGGQIDLQSAPGTGTTFQICLPEVTADAVGKPPEARRWAAGSGETVLLVEDQEDVRNYAVEVLTSRGFRVVPASSAAEAVAISEREPGRIHLLMTDVVMPRMSGPDLALALSQARPGISVLFMSGYTEDAAALQGALVAGAEFIAKPFSPEELTAKVMALLRPRLPDPRVLPGDDDEALRLLLRHALRPSGTVEGVGDAAEGTRPKGSVF